ncbi:MAG: hypothetical protein ACLT1K_02710 [[Clostridium] leptum]
MIRPRLGAPDMVQHAQPPAELLNLGVVGGFAVGRIRRQGGATSNRLG